MVPGRPGSQSQVLKVTSDLRQCTGNPNGWKHQESYKCHISDTSSDERGLTTLPDIWFLDSWENIPPKKIKLNEQAKNPMEVTCPQANLVGFGNWKSVVCAEILAPAAAINFQVSGTFPKL